MKLITKHVLPRHKHMLIMGGWYINNENHYFKMFSSNRFLVTTREINHKELYADRKRGNIASLLKSNVHKYFMIQMENEYQQMANSPLFHSKLNHEYRVKQYTEESALKTKLKLIEVDGELGDWYAGHIATVLNDNDRVSKSFLKMKFREAQFLNKTHKQLCYESEIRFVALMYYPLLRCVYSIANYVHSQNEIDCHGREFALKDLLLMVYNNSYVNLPYDQWEWDSISIYNHPLLNLIEGEALKRLDNSVQIHLPSTTKSIISKIEIACVSHQLSYFITCYRKAINEVTISDSQALVYRKSNLLIYILGFLMENESIERLFSDDLPNWIKTRNGSLPEYEDSSIVIIQI